MVYNVSYAHQVMFSIYSTYSDNGKQSRFFCFLNYKNPPINNDFRVEFCQGAAGCTETTPCAFLHLSCLNMHWVTSGQLTHGGRAGFHPSVWGLPHTEQVPLSDVAPAFPPPPSPPPGCRYCTLGGRVGWRVRTADVWYLIASHDDITWGQGYITTCRRVSRPGRLSRSIGSISTPTLLVKLHLRQEYPFTIYLYLLERLSWRATACNI